jgi:hypothetical protein
MDHSDETDDHSTLVMQAASTVPSLSRESPVMASRAGPEELPGTS